MNLYDCLDSWRYLFSFTELMGVVPMSLGDWIYRYHFHISTLGNSTASLNRYCL